jgi:hypothetical protein
MMFARATSTALSSLRMRKGDVALYYPCKQAFFVKGRKGGRPLYLLFKIKLIAEAEI